MPVAKNVRPDLEGLAHDPFHRISPCIDNRIDVLDQDTAIPAAGKGSTHVGTIFNGGGDAPRCKYGAAAGDMGKTASLINRSGLQIAESRKRNLSLPARNNKPTLSL